MSNAKKQKIKTGLNPAGRKMLQVPADLVAECWSIAQKRTKPTSWSQVAVEKLRDALKAAKPH